MTFSGYQWGPSIAFISTGCIKTSHRRCQIQTYVQNFFSLNHKGYSILDANWTRVCLITSNVTITSQQIHLVTFSQRNFKRNHFCCSICFLITCSLNHVAGYLIPKDSVILVSTASVHMDPKIYPNPKAFDPFRFQVRHLNFLWGGIHSNFHVNVIPNTSIVCSNFLFDSIGWYVIGNYWNYHVCVWELWCYITLLLFLHNKCGFRNLLWM